MSRSGELDARWGEEDGVLPTTFTEDELRMGLLRGTPVHEIVAGAGKHWEPNSLLSEQGKTWAFSEPLRRNTAFISHSWQASRFLKWLALLAFFNGRSAVAASVIAAVAAVVVDRCVHITPQLPFLISLVDGRSLEVTCTFLPFLAGLAVGFSTFFGGHHVRRVLETARLLAPQSVFLDKLAIHQDDPDRKQRGIGLLGAFIRSSDVFLVLWSKGYPSRLWCSYEVAVFMHLTRAPGYSGSLCIWPLPLAKVLAAKMIKSVAFGGFTILVSANFGMGVIGVTLLAIAMVAPNIVISVGLVEPFHEAVIMENQLVAYDLRTANCFNPADRDMVEAAVTAWFQPENRDEAIERFNAFVREDFRSNIGKSVGRGNINYMAALGAPLPVLFSNTLMLAGNVDIGLLNYVMVMIPAIVADIPVAMIVMALQYRAVSFIETCGESGRAYASVPQQDRAATSSSFSGLNRRPIALHIVVCAAVDVLVNFLVTLLQGVGGAPAAPVPVILSISISTVLFCICMYK